MRSPTAVSASAIPPIAYTIVQVLVILLTASAAQGQISLSEVGGTAEGDTLEIVRRVLVGLVVVGVGIVLVVPKLRHKVVPTVKTTLHNLWTVVTSPRKVDVHLRRHRCSRSSCTR